MVGRFDIFSAVANRMGNNVESMEVGFQAVVPGSKSVERDDGLPVELNLVEPGVRYISEVIIEVIFSFVCS